MAMDNVYGIRGRILVFFQHFFKEKHWMIISGYGNAGGYGIVYGFNLVEPFAFHYKDQFIIPVMGMGPGFFDDFLKPGYFEQSAVVEFVLEGYLAVCHC